MMIFIYQKHPMKKAVKNSQTHFKNFVPRKLFDPHD